jgi:type I restriction enzyme R subunit
MPNEALARIRINKLLDEAGWLFFDTNEAPANVFLENNVKVTRTQLDEWGDDFENVADGMIDFLLTDNEGKPLCVLEAKRESIHPLSAKEQARKYAKACGARYILLSNGIVHFWWDLHKGNPVPIYKFPSPDEIGAIREWNPDRQSLAAEEVYADYIVQVQMPDYRERPEWKGSIGTSKDFIWKNGLRFLRHYQLGAVHSLQKAVNEGKDRFLFEMATGTGKTLTAAAVIRLFLRTRNARRVLFLVDRLELEDQAWKAFNNYLKPDYTTYIFKEHKEDWRKAEIVVTTIQSLMANDRYRHQFSPTDFDFLISDESHRSISGNARAVFEYFNGYKLGLTATPKDYLKGLDINKVRESDPREIERRMLRDTYNTFGCEGGEPTFRYSLIDGVKDGFLVNPWVLDARTEITTQLLSDQGYAVLLPRPEGGEEEEVFVSNDFERKFFSEETNQIFCQTFLSNALTDPITREIGKTIVFAVSQNHAAKITQILNEMADQIYPGKYHSDFAVQVTSVVSDAQQMTINFTNNKLNGNSPWLEGYKTSKTRVCVTVGMMTTGYDCPDLLNLCMMRPIFSPTDFVQVKGRGTRRHTFEYSQKNEFGEEETITFEKEDFKLFDFFANCEYFEEKFDYNEKLFLPKPRPEITGPGGGGVNLDEYTNFLPDPLESLKEQKIGYEGMKVDRELFRKFEDRVKMDDVIRKHVELGNWEQVVSHIENEIFNKPEEYFTLEKIRKAERVDRKISVREVVEKIFGILPKFKSKDEMLEEEFDKFISIYPPEEDVNVRALKYFFKAYIVDQDIRAIIEARDFQALQTNATLTISQYKEVKEEYRTIIPDYVHDYVKLEQFAA